MTTFETRETKDLQSAAARLLSMLSVSMPKNKDYLEAQRLLDRALFEAERLGAREAVKRIRLRLAAEVDPQPQGGRILAILDEEAAR